MFDGFFIIQEAYVFIRGMVVSVGISGACPNDGHLGPCTVEIDGWASAELCRFNDHGLPVYLRGRPDELIFEWNIDRRSDRSVYSAG